MIDLNNIEAMAKAATPGPWHNQPISDDDCNTVGLSVHADAAKYPLIDEDHMPGMNDAEFIATANPAAVQEMIDLIRKQEAALTGAQARIGGLLLVQAGLVDALNYALFHLHGEERDVDGVEHKARLALSAAGVVL